jgi:hypothetical protein
MDKYYEELKPIVNEVTELFAPLCAKCCPSCRISCCAPCVEKNGYYTHNANMEDFKKKYGFDELKGFWGEQGCRIPRLYRSWCLYHICLKFQMVIAKDKGERGLNEFKEKVKECSERHMALIKKYGEDKVIW